MLDQPLVFHPLTYLPEGDAVVVGRPDIDSYVVLEPDAAEALRRLEGGALPSQVGRWYEETYGEQLDVDDYIETLRSSDFLAAEAGAAAGPAPVRFQRLGRVLLGPPALLGYLLLAVAAALLVSVHHRFAPQPANVFFVSSLSVVEIVMVFGQLPLLAAHEAFHALAGRRLGLPTRFGYTRRLYFLVFETQLNGLMSVPRCKRYLCFLAGMIFDVAAVAALTLAAYALRHEAGAAGVAGRLCLAMAFPVTVRIAYQFILFLRTDLYYVATTATGCYNLHEASKAVLLDWRSRLPGRARRRPDLDDFTEQDLHYGRVYAPLLLVGSVLLVALYVATLLPILWTVVRDVAVALVDGAPAATLADRIVFVAINLVEIVLVSVVSYRARRRAAPEGQS